MTLRSFQNKTKFALMWYFPRMFSKRSSNLIYTSSPRKIFEEKIKNGILMKDGRQKKLVQELERLYESIQSYQRRALGTSKIPKGLYIHGPVGGGKTMLMDVFYKSCPVTEKMRVHFNAFMLQVHQALHESKIKYNNKRQLPVNLIPLVLRMVVGKNWLICFDEFQVTDIADAIILKRIFTQLFRKGTVVVATSNRPPDDLYKHGLNREHFMPFIDVLKQHCNIVHLNTTIDYRTNLPLRNIRYFVKCDDGVDFIDTIFKVLSSKENYVIKPRTFNVMGRDVTFSRTCGGLLDSTFNELCGRPLGANDYLELSGVFHTILIRDVPQMGLKLKDQMRRFITLIDILYDHKVRVVISAYVPMDSLFSKEQDYKLNDEQKHLMDDLGISVRDEDAKANVFSGDEEVFAIDRALSRLSEMQTKEYWDARRDAPSIN